MSAPHAGVMVLRIAVGAALGGVIGYERDRHGRPVGLRTHVIVGLAAATFMIVSAFFYELQGYSAGEGVEVDASRIAASVVSGIGFLAGGAILRNGLTIQGLTTAAGLWLVTAIGLCAGAGMFIVAASVTAMGVVTLTIMRRLEGKVDDLARHRVEASLSGEPDAMFAALTTLGGRVERLDYERRVDEGAVVVACDVVIPADIGVARMIAAIEQVPGLRRVRIGNATPG